MKKSIYIAVLLLGGVIVSNAQKTQVRKAQEQYNKLEYIDAIATYEKVAGKGYKTAEMMKQLGNAYYFNAQYTDAAKWYAEMFALKATARNPEYYLRYSLSLKSVGDYAKANEYLEKYYRARGEARPEVKTYLDIIEENSGRYTIENAEVINSELSDYGSTIYNGELIFTSTRKAEKFLPRSHSWNNQPHSILYSSGIDVNGNLQAVEPFSKKLDSKFDEATPVFTSDGNTVYFTRNNYLTKRGYSRNRTTLLKIYRSTLIEDKWSEITELPFNSDDYNVAHPALSPDNKTLYFTSDMPGSMGDADIWKVAVYEDGTFGVPVNLGPAVNTEGRESFPFISSDNKLYYASTGKLGLGGLDIFMSKITDDENYEEAINIGKPINGPVDDFAFYIDSESRTGFFSSNREGGMGDDDIYRFTEHKELICEQLLAGTITDVDTGEYLAAAIIELYDDNEMLLAKTITDEQGAYLFDKEIICDLLYRVRASQKNYSTDEDAVKIPNKTGESRLNLSLKRTREILAPGTDLRFVLGIPDIYFDLDKWNIRTDAEIELQKILNVMSEYPDLIVDIRSHTDCRASHAYNEKLSDRRAKSSRQWLIDQGIAPERLTAKGYGETRLVNHCTDGVACTEEEHQQNRRSEFIVVSGGE